MTEERTPAGRQIVLQGAEPISSAALAKRRAAAPLKPKAAQRPLDIGLFGDGASQTDLMDMIAAKRPDPAVELRSLWTAQGVSLERQEALIAEIAAKAQPGTQIGPFRISREAR